ncbi:STAS domain-containing protein [Streptosporangium sp. NPDC002721]|uniref:STAS domain-containing protein n=1 Tax=Streptosporangium sp. NPDC002721 TaxID=3366188 RepID=UPI003673DC0F
MTVISLRPGTFPVEIRTWRLETLRILRLPGELDVFIASRVRAVLDEVGAAHREFRLIVDLTRLTFMTSAGVGLPLEVRDRVGERGERLVVIPAPDSHPWLIRMADHFEVEQSMRGVVDALRQTEHDPAVRGRTGEKPQIGFGVRPTNKKRPGDE